MIEFFNRLKRFIYHYFDFSKKETDGFLFLMAGMIVLLLAPMAIERYYPESVPDTATDNRILDSLIALSNNVKVEEITYDMPAPTYPKASLFNFNPNSISTEDLIKLGIRPYIAERIIKYRSKGGTFKVKADLKKIYGFPETQYETLEPYILLPAEEQKDKDLKPLIPTRSYLTKAIAPQDINLADSTGLEKIHGIGFKLASRIIKYRKKLGGFIAMQQLKEVYGLDSMVLEELNKKFIIDEGFDPVKININDADFETLKNHPYIGYKLAKVILSFKSMHGAFHSQDQLKEIKAISEQDLTKMAPYLHF